MIPRLFRATAWSGVLLSAGSAWACSGPGARDAIDQASTISLAAFGVSCVLVVALWVRAFKRRVPVRWVAAAVATLVLGLHPIFWRSPGAGDCGLSLVVFSAAALVLQVGVGLLTVFPKRE